MFAVGATIGSFLNVVITRLPEEESIVRPRSRCPRCKHPIAWYDNIPLLSWLILRARCRHCGESISARYPLVELLMAMLTVAVWLRFGVSWELLLWIPLTGALLAIVFLDIDHWWVPDVITLPAIAVVAATAFIPGGITPLEAGVGLIPAASILLIGWIFQLVTGREGMGLGDVKLLALIGLAVGPIDGLAVLLLASVQGSLIGLVVVVTGGHKGVDASESEGETDVDTGGGAETEFATADNGSEPDEDNWVPHPRAFPFGPFLVLGALEVVLLPHLFSDLPRRITNLLIGWVG
jgi:leader peptidase (prepilin peptidase)/N-methyltransferase